MSENSRGGPRTRPVARYRTVLGAALDTSANELAADHQSQRRSRHQKDEVPTEVEWEEEARAILTALLEREKLNSKSLSTLLSQRGVCCTPRAVREKIRRGSFPFTFFMQVLVALGVGPGEITIALTLPPPTNERLKDCDQAAAPDTERRSQARKAGKFRRQLANER